MKQIAIKITPLILAGLIFSTTVMSQAAYDPAKCAEVAGTLNFSWVETLPTPNGCVGIETTNGTEAMARSGRLQMQGTSASSACLSTDTYDLTLSSDGNSLVGTSTSGETVTALTFTRAPGQACFTGHWVRDDLDFLGYITAEFFPRAAPTPPASIPTLSEYGLMALASLMGMLGIAAARRKRELS